MAALSEATITTIGVILSAFLTGAFALAGIIITMGRQKNPLRVEPHVPTRAVECEGCDACKSALASALAERDVWRQLAEEWKPQRRADDAG